MYKEQGFLHVLLCTMLLLMKRNLRMLYLPIPSHWTTTGDMLWCVLWLPIDCNNRDPSDWNPDSHE